MNTTQGGPTLTTVAENITKLATTLDDVLEAVNRGFSLQDEHFDIKIDQKLQKLEERLDKKLEEKLAPIRATMVTKEYLDKKMAEQKGEMMLIIRKEDTKLTTLVEKLGDKKVLNQTDTKQLLAMEPFAR